VQPPSSVNKSMTRKRAYMFILERRGCRVCVDAGCDIFTSRKVVEASNALLHDRPLAGMLAR